MSGFAPVHLPEDRKLNGRLSQSFLRHYAGCPRSGYLYALHKGVASTADMQRGKALHLVHERAVRLMIEHGEVTIPPEIVKDLVNVVLAEVPVPFEQHDVIREMAFRMASEMVVDPSADVFTAAETLFALEVGGYQVRCRIDFAQVTQDGALLSLEDLKSSRAAPAYEEVSRTRADGTLAAKAMQLILYSLAAVFGVPVREEECPRCEGAGEVAKNFGLHAAEHPEIVECPDCAGRGVRETPEPFPVAGRAQRVELAYVFPAREDREGKMVRRRMTLTRPELPEYMASLEGLLARVAHSEETGDWPAVVSDAACSICPASGECPIPVELRDHRGSINTAEECADALSVRHREKAVSRAKVKEIREAVKRLGPVKFGDGMVAEIGFSESERIADKDAMWEALERTRRYGDPFERHRYVKSVESFPLVERALTAEELAEEVDDGEGRGVTADERWGAEAPFE